ncbi:hypothetical protein [Aquisalimonas sp.]|uniref:hypothetical protein n=1 Tax=Aquisalimonas sp. TaxID=1872621 RepID=UPI0025C4343B|nr:hypothetical protein [Aquisalimonas sp.]
MEQPQEVWATFRKSSRTGRVAMRVSALQVVDTGRDRPMPLMLYAQPACWSDGR